MKNSHISAAIIFLLFLMPSCNWFEGMGQLDNEKISFSSGDFEIFGEVIYPEGKGPFPLVIMVHGDGPAYMSYFSKVKERILNAGYATLMWDKPGFGKSTGMFSEKHMQQDRADILMDAISTMQKYPKINGDRIGVWGISQAGYVIPRVLEKSDAIKFMILVGCGGENGIQQTAYYIESQLMCVGVSEDEAKTAGQNFKGLYHAKTFEEYYQCAKPLVDDPIIREMGFVTAMWTEEQWKPKELTDEGFYDPISIYEKSKVPALVFFGDLDKNVDPIQGMESYKHAFQRAGNPNFKVILIKDADHNIIISKTGCVGERQARSRKGWSNYDPEYLSMMEEWLTILYTQHSKIKEP